MQTMKVSIKNLLFKCLFKGYFNETFYYAGIVQNIPDFVNLQWRLRLGYADTNKVDANALDARYELNYLF